MQYLVISYFICIQPVINSSQFLFTIVQYFVILSFCIFFICIHPVINCSQLMLIRSTTAPLTFHNGFSQIKETDNSPSNVLTPSRHSFCSFCLQSVLNIFLAFSHTTALPMGRGRCVEFCQFAEMTTTFTAARRSTVYGTFCFQTSPD